MVAVRIQAPYQASHRIPAPPVRWAVFVVLQAMTAAPDSAARHAASRISAGTMGADGGFCV